MLRNYRPSSGIAIVAAIPPYGDVGAFSACVSYHPYLDCHDCGRQLRWGETDTGAPVYACVECKLVCDTRRVP